MRIDIDIVQMPDWARAAREFDETTTGAVLRAAVLMIIDNTDRMKNRVTLLGGPQKQNSESWADHKRRTRGHDIPLVYGNPDPILSNPRRWLVNGRPAAQMVAKALRNFRTYARLYGQTKKGFRLRSRGLQFVVVKLPPERESVASELEAMGYSIPFGMPAEVVQVFMREVETELAKFQVHAVTKTKGGIPEVTIVEAWA